MKKPEWDSSTVASKKEKPSLEDRMASKIAADILKDNHKLKGVHSNMSMKKILEKEALKQLLAEGGGSYQTPVVATLIEKGKIDKADPSNLPYLNRCPAL